MSSASSAVVEIQSLPTPDRGEWRPGSLVVYGKTKWIILKIIRIHDKVVVYLIRPKGRKVHIAVFIEARNGWVPTRPTPLPGF